MKKLSLLEVLEGIEDSRRERSVWYPLHEVLFIFLAAVICGATSYVKVEMFGKSKGMTAAQILEAKRSHWGIENKLHIVTEGFNTPTEPFITSSNKPG